MNIIHRLLYIILGFVICKSGQYDYAVDYIIIIVLVIVGIAIGNAIGNAIENKYGE
jgi:hypothetical protein